MCVYMDFGTRVISWIHLTLYIPTSGNLVLLITFTNSLDPDQAQQNVEPNLGLICLTLMVFLKKFFPQKFLKNPQTAKIAKLPMHL